jgi:predicted nucleotidyltransferase
MPSATMRDDTRERLGVGPLVEALQHRLAGTLWGVVLFGSTARGEATESSDLDILVVADGVPERLPGRLMPGGAGR